MNTVSLHFRKITALCLIFCALSCFALSPQTQAVNPPLTPDPGSKPVSNTADGQNALLSVTTGIHNSAFGFDALLSNTDANFNTAVGSAALLSNDGTENTAVGCGALLSNTSGAGNTANGAFALFFNTIGGGNTAVGVAALENNTEGAANTATGQSALQNNLTGANNTADGSLALSGNTSGSQNTAIGDFTLPSNNGDFNTAVGNNALAANTTGSFNTATGFGALLSNTTGNNNTAVGLFAGDAGGMGNGNVALGACAGQTIGDNNIAIGNLGGSTESNTIRIGTVTAEKNCSGIIQSAHTATYIAGISGTAVTGDTVVVNGNGQLGTVASAARFKKEVRPMDKASEAILALKPVTFRYKKELDPNGIPQFGLVAEEVAKVNPDLVVRDRNGKIYSVRYEAVNAMLLNEFLKEHRKVEQLEKQIEALNAGLQKVSAQLEASKSATQVAGSNY